MPSVSGGLKKAETPLYKDKLLRSVAPPQSSPSNRHTRLRRITTREALESGRGCQPHLSHLVVPSIDLDTDAIASSRGRRVQRGA